jgi:hypothetical protein
MEENTQVTPAEIEEQLLSLAPLNVIRTETVLSRLPIHNLAKKGSVNIHIVRKDTQGRVDLLWKVSPSRDYGEPRSLAYKLDTIAINRRIDEQGRPLPKIIRLGSLRELAQELELGSDTATVRKALLQNASAFITAKLTYKSNDGRLCRLETGFSRYSVIFTGEQLPDGTKADAVCLILNDPYREVLNNAPVRPLDYDYLRQLPPAAQRFYEILSRKFFAALKFKHPTASLTYSEYCTYSAQRRYFDRQPMQNQMSAIHREHKKFGYIESVRYEPTLDGDDKADWVMHYVPGPKAKAEYHAFTRSGRITEIIAEPATAEARPAIAASAKRRAYAPRQRTLRFDPAPADSGAAEHPMLGELTRRGIAEAKARALLAAADGDQVLDLLEWGDSLISANRAAFRNPAGFYIHLVSQKITPPDDFESSRKRKIRESAAAERQRRHDEKARLEDAYNDYRRDAVARYIAQHVPAEQLEALTVRKASERRRQYPLLPPDTIRQMAEREAKADYARLAPMPTFEAFAAERRHEVLGTDSQ